MIEITTEMHRVRDRKGTTTVVLEGRHFRQQHFMEVERQNWISILNLADLNK